MRIVLMMADTFQWRVVAPVRSALLLSHPTLLTLSRTWQQSGSGGTVDVGAELGGSTRWYRSHNRLRQVVAFELKFYHLN
jgi:hypothetical protein